MSAEAKGIAERAERQAWVIRSPREGGTYTVTELADILCVPLEAVRAWLFQGAPVAEPGLFMGVRERPGGAVTAGQLRAAIEASNEFKVYVAGKVPHTNNGSESHEPDTGQFV